MSKLVALAVAGAGATAVTVGGVYVMRGSGTGAEQKLEDKQEPKQSTPQVKEDKKLLFDSVSSFKKSANSSDCVKKYFSGIDFSKGDDSVTEIKDNTQPAANTFFKADATGTTTPYESCLMVNGTRETYGEEASSKGKGTFTGTWTFVRGDEGFINFNLTKTTDEGKLTSEGILYLVSKNASGSWELKYKKPHKNTITYDKTDLGNYFPELGTIKDYTGKKYWEFIKDDKSDVDSICKTGECTAEDGNPKKPTVKDERMIWKKTTGDKKLQGWANNLTGWDKMYAKSEFNLEDKIKDFVGEGALDTAVSRPGS